MSADASRGRRAAWARAVGAVVVVLLGLNVAARVLDESLSAGGGSDVASSSYGDSSEGMSAFAELLSRSGHPIERQRGALADSAPDPATTTFVLDPEVLDDDDTTALVEFVTRGGRLVIGGPDAGSYLRQILNDPPTWTPRGRDIWRATRLGLATVVGAGAGSFSNLGSSTAVVDDADTALVAEATRGDGTVVMLADVSPLTNGRLADADNAALGVLLAGRDGRVVVFAEGVHGFGASTGLAAIPIRWRVGLGVLALAAVTFAVARARRIGPPVTPSPAPTPARGEYVEAIAATLARSGDRAGAAEALRERLGTPDDAAPIDQTRRVVIDDADLLAIAREFWTARKIKESQ